MGRPDVLAGRQCRQSEGVTVSDAVVRTQLPIPDRPYEG